MATRARGSTRWLLATGAFDPFQTFAKPLNHHFTPCLIYKQSVNYAEIRLASFTLSACVYLLVYALPD
jgi:phage tail sheath gpL-like